MLKKKLLLIGSVILICLLSGLAVYMFTSGSTEDPRRDRWDLSFVSDLKFIDGGPGNDTVVATTVNRTNEPLTITSGYVAQSYWLDKGFVYQNHEQAAELFGDLTIPINGTKDIHLSLPKDTLIPGKSYAVELNTTQQHPSSVKYIDSPNSFNTISAPETFTFYHMCHPNMPGKVEEGVITSLNAAFCDSNYADSMSATVQNTGDFPITITGGFVNGRAAINAADSSIHITGIEQCIIEKNANKSVTLNFPAGSLYYTRGSPFNVKLVTAEGNIIEGPDFLYCGFSSMNHRVRQPEISKEQAIITGVKFSGVGANDSLVAVTIHNSGSNPIIISSGLLNGKATTILSNNTTVNGGGMQTFTLQAGTLVEGREYQVVLISSQNNAFIHASTYNSP